DSLRLAGEELRLVGIDAPEGRQTCQRSGQRWRCGEAAAQKLRRLVASRDLSCQAEKRDQHKRLLATCRANGRNVNREMVATGMAVAFGKRYRREEADAKRRRSGLWASEFQRPQQWRRQNM
ncbi:MAG: thermonuclease family protein, partial [Pseudomonadota bacterium]